MTVLEIIQAAFSRGMGGDRDTIPNDVISGALDSYEKIGKSIYDSYTWDNRIAEQAAFTPNATTGVITFSATVDDILAVKAVSTNSDTTNDTFVWPQDQVNAAMLGTIVSSDSWTQLADSGGVRRILTQADDEVTSYRVLYTIRFVPAIVDAAYSAADPTATPTDYRVLTWLVDKLDPVIVEAMTDELAGWIGERPNNKWQGMLKQVKRNIQEQSGREKIITIQAPMFADTSDWMTGLL